MTVSQRSKVECVSQSCDNHVYRTVIKPCQHLAVRCTSCLEITRECSTCEGHIEEMVVTLGNDSNINGFNTRNCGLTGYCFGICQTCHAVRSDLFLRHCCNTYVCGPCLYPTVLKTAITCGQANTNCGHCGIPYPVNSRLYKSLGTIFVFSSFKNKLK